MRKGLVVVLALLASRAAEARVVEGSVFVDANDDGLLNPGETTVPGAVVAYGIEQFVVTGAGGTFTLDVPEAPGIVWVRVPDGFQPGPVWARLPPQSARVDLALHRLPAPLRGPLTFVVTADTHLAGDQPFFADLRDVALAATALDPPPAFFTILGDVTQSNKPAQFELVDRSLAYLGVPYIPVPGNHDWYDGGTAWGAHYGPDNYSFDIDTTHFVVWNMAMSTEDLAHYLGAELARVPEAMTIVALTHAPPSPEAIQVLERLGVDYVLTGHTHSNRVVDHGGVLELSTEPLLMGGLDFTPAGYRVVTLDAGRLTAFHRTVVEPFLEVTAPAAGQCVAPHGGSLLVAAELDAGSTTVEARIDCGTPFALRFTGGWSWRAELPALPPGPHRVTVEARSSSGVTRTRAHAFEVCAPREPLARAGAPWSQLGGNAAHTGSTPHELAPPLATRWTTSVGGHVLQGSPVIDHDSVYVVTADLGDGRGGGIVALELASGAVRWKTPSELPIRGAAAVVGDTVIASQIDGTVLGVDTQSGAIRWRYELLGVEPRGAATFGAPVADGGDVLIGNQRHVAAIDASTGAAVWARDPVRRHQDFHSMSAIAVADGIAVGVFDRELGGVFAWDRVSAELLWHRAGIQVNSINASPVIDDGVVYLVNGATEVLALELLTGETRWQVKLDPLGFEWAIATIGTPALAHGILVVPTLGGDLFALDVTSGRTLWRTHATPGPLRAIHYRGAGEPGVEASPVIAGSVAWTVDLAGRLAALDLLTGAELWHHELRVPVLANPAVSGDWIVVAAYDGTVRALTHTAQPRRALGEPTASCAAPPRGGCCEAGASPTGPVLLLVVVAHALRRRRRSSKSARPSGASPAPPPVLHE
ncbi:MAG: PQQ-binding-like beta-propeller repeat protein [Kofleriaceae bacterium]|nr:PQQ-binding-like beta-propeller repeat protein [Kofleriaceae bacterium]